MSDSCQWIVSYDEHGLDKLTLDCASSWVTMQWSQERIEKAIKDAKEGKPCFNCYRVVSDIDSVGLD